MGRSNRNEKVEGIDEDISREREREGERNRVLLALVFR